VNALLERITIADPRKLPLNNVWSEEECCHIINGEVLFLLHPPRMVHFPDTNTRFYFWYDGDFDKWFINYMVNTGDYQGKNFTVYEMYSKKLIDIFNKYRHYDCEHDNKPYLTSKSYTYYLGNKKFYFVPKVVKLMVTLV